MTMEDPVTPTKQVTWGIIRYAAGSGNFPVDDAAGFDGWYSDREEALAVARDWAALHPHWIVALVQSDLVWFGNGDFQGFRDRPFTKRETHFARQNDARPAD
jgi:hypothetical protein